ncbi:hypothetical protein HYH02_003089 [Chlamydomonas schloesseri]|uniref:Ndc10 domain-containing protein n=1 Tax=Chlamydomonas schloesseri TaxID=2026947 RepID=A0A835WQ66_9CHLO|nr:hypothetical protein HYH02_003089 [Chlamydomonas schloesseri]|eukprot:KAG2452053.1 hypothetical protein HYH02_003089 [Chlamydomonas schloesseri]
MPPRKKQKKANQHARGKNNTQQQDVGAGGRGRGGRWAGAGGGEEGGDTEAILLPAGDLLPAGAGDGPLATAALAAIAALRAGEGGLDAALMPEEEDLPEPVPPEPKPAEHRHEGAAAAPEPDAPGAEAAAPRVFGVEEVRAVVQGRRDVQPVNTTSAYDSRLKKHLKPVCDLYKKDMRKIWGLELAQLGTVAVGNMGKQGYAASTIRNLSSAIRWLCWENRNKQGISCDFKNAGDYELFRQANKWAQRVIKGQGPRRQGDPQASTAADTYTAAEYALIAELLVQGQTASNALGMTRLGLAQTQALFHIMHFGAGRGDDTRVMMLADIGKPREVLALSGVTPCVMVPIVLYGTKTQRTDKPSYIALVRAKDVLKCPVRALGELLFVRFTLLQEEFPDLADEDAWLSAPLLRKEDKGAKTATPTPMDYDAMAALVKKVLDVCKIHVCKVTHCMRAGGAQVLEGEGVPLPTIERYGRWSISSSVVDVYLTNAPPDALLAMGGYGYCTGPAMQTAFFAPRFKAVLPEELLLPLINHLMPNLEALRECAKGIKGSDPARMSAINFPEVLTYLMGVLVQDSLELADRAPANPVVQWLQKRDEWHTLRERYLMCREELARCKPPTTMEAISYQSRQNAQLSRQNAQLSQQLSQLLNTLGQQVQAVGPDGPQQLAQMGGPQQLAPSAAAQQVQVGWLGGPPFMQPQQLAPSAAALQAQMGGPQQLAPFAAAQQVQVGWPGGPPFMQPQQLAPFAAALQAQMGGPQQLAPFAAAQQVQVGGPQQLAPFTAAQQVQVGWPGGPPFMQPQQLAPFTAALQAQMGGPQQLAPFAAAQQVQVGGPQQLAPFTAAQQVQVGWPGGPPFMQPQQLAPFAAAQHAQVGGPQQLTPSAAAQHAHVGWPGGPPFMQPQQLAPFTAAQHAQVGGPQQLTPSAAAQHAQVGGPQQLTPSAAAQHAQVGGPQQLAPSAAAQQAQVGGPQQLTPSAAAQQVQVGGPQQLAPFTAAQQAQVGGPQQLTPSAAAQHAQVGGPQQLAPFTAAQQVQVGGPQQLTPSTAAQQAQVGWPGGPPFMQPQQLAPSVADVTWFSPGGLQRRAAENVEDIMAGRAPLPAVACGVAAGGAALELQMLSPESRHRRADEVVAATMEGRAAPPLGSGRATGGDATGGAATGGAASGSAAACGAAVLAVASKQTKKKEPAAVVQAGASAAVLWKWRSDAVELKFLMDGALPYRKNELTTLLELYDAYYRGCPTDCGGRMPPWIDLFNLYGPKDDRNALANMEAGSWYPGGKVAKQLTQRMWEFRSLHRWCIVVTGELRGRGLKEAAEFWAGKAKQTLKPFWEDVVQHIVEEPALLKEIVAVSPSAADWRQRLHDVLPADLGAAFAATGNTAGGAAGSGAAAGGVGEAFAATGNTAGGTAGGGAAAGGVGEPVARAKNVLYLWLQAKAAEPGPDMTLSERMQGWFTMTYAERTAWKARYKMIRC